MDRPPLPDPVARRARSYLAALVPAAQVSDAWHELLADVAYWGDRDELPVLRLAHQVVLQHERVTDEVAVLALDELGISSPPPVAEVLDVSTSHAATLLDRVAASVEEDGGPADVHVFDAEVGAVGTRPANRDDAPADEGPADVAPTADPPAGDASAADPPADADAEPTPAQDGSAESRAVRIGFEDDHVIEVGDWDEEPTGLDARRWLAIVAVVVVAAVLLWVLVG